MGNLLRLFLSTFVLTLGLCSSMLSAFAQPAGQAGQVFFQRIVGKSAASKGPFALSPFTLQGTASNWGGWEVGASQRDEFKAVEGNWNAPCSSTPRDSHHQYGSWVGLGGDISGDSLEQTGIALQTDGTYRMFWEYVFSNGTGSPPVIDTTDVVKCGDHLTAWVHLGSSYCPNGGFDTYIKDTTSGKFKNHPCDASHPLGSGTAEWIDERPATSCGLTQLADFHSTSWSNVQAQADSPGATFHGPNSFINTRLVMEDSTGYLVLPSSTVSSTNTFTDTWFGYGKYC